MIPWSDNSEHGLTAMPYFSQGLPMVNHVNDGVAGQRRALHIISGTGQSHAV